MNDAVEMLSDYLRYRKECGERTVALDAETLAALKASTEGSGGQRAGGAGQRAGGAGQRAGGRQPPAPPREQEEAREQRGTHTTTASGLQQETASGQRQGTASGLQQETASGQRQETAGGLQQETASGLQQEGDTGARLATAGGLRQEGGPDFLFVGEKEAITDAGYVATMKGMVAAMGYAWKDVAFSNICGERNSAKPPTEAEMAIALPAFKQKVARLQPRAIIVLGEVAALGLLGNRDIAALRQRPHTFEGLPAIPTYHPAYLNKFGNAVKADACRDLRKALLRIGRPVPAVLERFK